MSIDLMISIFGWAAVLNYTVLIIWFLMFMLVRDWIYGLHRKWFKLSDETFDAIHYSAMAFYKLGIFLFLLGPYFAMKLVT